MGLHRWSRLATPALLLFFGVWGARAILLDNHPTFTDSLLPDSVRLYLSLTRGLSDFGAYLDFARYRPPLCYLPASLAYLVSGPSLTVLRLTVLLQYLAAVWLVFTIAYRATRSRQAGFFAAVVSGTLPMTFGWGRMSYAETGMALLVLIALLILLDSELTRPKQGIALGAVAGLGMLTKVAFPVFAIGPLIWTLLFRTRSRRQLAVLGLAAAVAGLSIAWWYIPQWRYVMLNMRMSSDPQGAGPTAATYLVRFLSYTVELEGVIWVLGLALVGSVLAWRQKVLPGQLLALLSLATWVPLAAILLFHQSRRYPLPVYWVAGLLAGLCLQAILARVNRRLATVAVSVLSMLLLGDFVVLNLGWRRIAVPAGSALPVAGPRVDGVGLIAPDRRPFKVHPAAMEAAAAGRLTTCLAVFSGVRAHEMFAARDQLFRLKGGRRIELEESWQTYRERRPERPCVLLVSDHPTGGDTWDAIPISERGLESLCRAHAWFVQVARRRRIGSWGPSPLGLRYTIYRLDADELERPPRRWPARCRAKPTFWDAAIHR